MKPKILVTRQLPVEALEPLRTPYQVDVYPYDSAMTEAQLVEAGREIVGLLVAGSPVTKAVVSQCPKLRAVATPSAGYDNIDVAVCTDRKIAVTNIAGILEDVTADLAFALLLAVARRILEADKYVREGHWLQWRWRLLLGADVHHKTLGIYGLGRIGQAMAKRGQAFAMHILYHSRRKAPAAIEQKLGAQYVDRETLLRESDFLSLHVPLSAETHHLIQARDLSLMKSTAFLINTSRGAAVDEEALVQALKAGTLAGAGLDVFENEPHIHPELISMNNVVLMPHLGTATANARLRSAVMAVENLLAALDGRRPPNLVNPEVFD